MTYRFVFITALAFAGCSDASTPAESLAFNGSVAGLHRGASYGNGGPLPEQELAAVRRATARYHDVDAALADGYVDVNIVVPNMGRHLLKGGLVDEQFVAEQPELLVYAPDARGLTLVAVEYAVARPLSEAPPEGFSGPADGWFADQGFDLWTLHAWVWRENPDGIFNPTNSRVP